MALPSVHETRSRIVSTTSSTTRAGFLPRESGAPARSSSRACWATDASVLPASVVMAGSHRSLRTPGVAFNQVMGTVSAGSPARIPLMKSTLAFGSPCRRLRPTNSLIARRERTRWHRVQVVLQSFVRDGAVLRDHLLDHHVQHLNRRRWIRARSRSDGIVIHRPAGRIHVGARIGSVRGRR